MSIAATRVGTESIFVQCIAMATMARPILCSFHFYYFVATPSELSVDAARTNVRLPAANMQNFANMQNIFFEQNCF